MPKMPYIPIYFGDWQAGPIAGTSLTAQGLWLRMSFVMATSERYGYLQMNRAPTPPGSVAQRCGCTLEQYVSFLRELDEAGVLSRTADGIIYSADMVEDFRKREKSKRDGALGGNPKVIRGVNPKLQKDSIEIESENEIDSSAEEIEPGEKMTAPKTLATPEFAEAWAQWVRYRRDEVKKPISRSMAESQFKKFAKIGVVRAVEMIEHTIANGWWGLREDDAGLSPSTSKNGAAAKRSGERAERPPIMTGPITYNDG